jgi:hypothetical protein
MAGFPVVMEEIATLLNVDDVLATTDPIRAANNRPCLLVVPPVVDYAGGTFETPNHECRVFALASSSTWGADAADECAALLDHAAGLLEDLQRAEPTLYRLTESRQVPAYLLTFTTL